MGFTKYQKTEAAEVVSPEGQAAIADELHKMGKTSARDLTPEERKAVSDSAEKRDS